jgi:hypothetical protein
MFTRKTLIWLSLAVLVALALAACSTQAQPAPATSAPQPTQTSPPAPTNTSAPTATPRPTQPPPTATPRPTATESADAAGALLDVIGEGANMESAHFTLNMTMTINMVAQETPVALTLGMTGEGDTQVGETPKDSRVHVTIDTSLFGQSFTTEIIQAEGRQWTRLGDGDWEENEEFVTSTAEQSDFSTNPAAALAMLSAVEEVRELRNETIDGVETKHVGFTIDMTKMLTAPGIIGQLQGEDTTPEQVAELLRNATMEGELWYGADDNFVRQMRYTMTFDMQGLEGMPAGAEATATLDMLMTFSDINEPVEIEPPVQ